jgi:quercetin dioxygenase-like cupin family protein
MPSKHLSGPAAFAIALLAGAAAAAGQTTAGAGAGDGSNLRPYGFGPDQTIVDIGRVAWEPLRLDGLPPGAEIAVLRGDLAKGGAEILLRFPPGYAVPVHSHTSDELYVWLVGAFTYVAADGAERDLRAPAYISLPGGVAHGLRCGPEPCVLFLRYSRPFDLHVHAAPGSAPARR